MADEQSTPTPTDKPTGTCAIGNCRRHPDWAITTTDDTLAMCEPHFRLTRVAGWEPTT